MTDLGLNWDLPLVLLNDGSAGLGASGSQKVSVTLSPVLKLMLCRRGHRHRWTRLDF